MMGSVQGSPQHRLNSSAGTQLLSSRVSHCRRVDRGAGMTHASYIRVLGFEFPLGFQSSLLLLQTMEVAVMAHATGFLSLTWEACVEF